MKVEPATATFTYALDRTKLRQAPHREGRYLLRSNLTEADPATLWAYYLQLVQVEEAFLPVVAPASIAVDHANEDGHPVENVDGNGNRYRDVDLDQYGDADGDDDELARAELRAVRAQSDGVLGSERER